MTRTRLLQSFFRPTCVPSSSRAAAGLRCRLSPVRYQHLAANDSHLPRIAQSSLWESIVPRSLRERTSEAFRAPSKRSVNPASYFIWIYILIGSQAIRILGVQNEFNAYMRKADVRIDKLREVVEKLQKGEPVDVEKVLGTGDEEQEQEWDVALKEIENEERRWQEGRRLKQEEEDRRHAERQDASPVSEGQVEAEEAPDLPDSIPRAPSQPGFY